MSCPAYDDDTGVVGYRVLFNGFFVLATQQTRATLAWLNDSNTYVIQVRALDVAGNEGPSRPTLLVSRPAPDPEPTSPGHSIRTHHEAHRLRVAGTIESREQTTGTKDPLSQRDTGQRHRGGRLLTSLVLLCSRSALRGPDLREFTLVRCAGVERQPDCSLVPKERLCT